MIVLFYHRTIRNDNLNVVLTIFHKKMFILVSLTTIAVVTV